MRHLWAIRNLVGCRQNAGANWRTRTLKWFNDLAGKKSDPKPKAQNYSNHHQTGFWHPLNQITLYDGRHNTSRLCEWLVIMLKDELFEETNFVAFFRTTKPTLKTSIILIQLTRLNCILRFIILIIQYYNIAPYDNFIVYASQYRHLRNEISH